MKKTLNERAAYMRDYYKRSLRYRSYSTWGKMRSRCENPEDKAFQFYGARGIKLCKAWRDFEVFFRWVQRSGFEVGLQIDRIDNDGNYTPRNCRWVTSKNNNRNRGNNKLDVEKVAEIRKLLGEGHTGPELARQFGVHHSLIYRIKLNQQWL